MSKKLMRIRMTTSSTAARAGTVIERQEAEAKRLIAAGYAVPHDDVDYATKSELEALAARVAALEDGSAKAEAPPEKPGKGK